MRRWRYEPTVPPSSTEVILLSVSLGPSRQSGRRPALDLERRRRGGWDGEEGEKRG